MTTHAYGKDGAGLCGETREDAAALRALAYRGGWQVRMPAVRGIEIACDDPTGKSLEAPAWEPPPSKVADQRSRSAHDAEPFDVDSKGIDCPYCLALLAARTERGPVAAVAAKVAPRSEASIRASRAALEDLHRHPPRWLPLGPIAGLRRDLAPR